MIRCPVCGGGKYAPLSIHTHNDYSMFIELKAHNKISPCICLNCGAVFIKPYDLNKIKEGMKGCGN